MQKRGKFLIGEDFTPIAPKMTIQDQNGYATRTEMKEDRKRKDMTLITAQNDKFESETLRKLQEQGQIKPVKNTKAETSKVATRNTTPVTLKQQLRQKDKKEHRAKLGLLVEPNNVTEHHHLDSGQREGIKTTQQLLDKRFVLDNKDIRDKTVKGQAIFQKHQATRDIDQRYRYPELKSVYDYPTDPGQKAFSKR